MIKRKKNGLDKKVESVAVESKNWHYRSARIGLFKKSS
jgi:hypothetical protein